MIFKKRKITSIEDLSQDERLAVMKSLDQMPCIPFTMKFLKEKYSQHINVDFTKVKDADLDTIHLLTPEQVRLLFMHDFESLRELCGLMNVKAIYAKAYMSFVIDKKEMDMTLDEFRARCKSEYDEVIKCQQ